jgi:hypothetical protein
VNIGVVFVDEGMVAVEIPVVERPYIVALIGNVAIQRGHCVQVRRAHGAVQSGWMVSSHKTDKLAGRRIIGTLSAGNGKRRTSGTLDPQQ